MWGSRRSAGEHAYLPRQPKEIVIVPGGHFDAYVKSFEVFSGHARDWFIRYLAA